MLECFEFEKVEPGSLEYLREMQLIELRGYVQDFIEEGIITYKAIFVRVAIEKKTIGYACIGTYEYYKDIILEFYLVNKYRSYSGKVLKQLSSFYGCKRCFVNSQDFFLLPLLLDLRLSFEINGFIFEVDNSTDMDYKFEQDVSFEVTKKEELQEVYELIIQDDFYTGGGIETVELRLAVNELYSLIVGGRLIGVGFISILKRTPGYADIAMIIEKKERQKGWGTLMLRNLMHKCKLQNIIPIASCDKKNEISRRTLHKAGFYLVGCMLLAKIE